MCINNCVLLFSLLFSIDLDVTAVLVVTAVLISFLLFFTTAILLQFKTTFRYELITYTY